MGMDTNDIQYFDGKFGRLHKRIDELDKTISKTITQLAVTNNEVEHVKTDLGCHIKKPCKNVGDHYDDEHKPRLGRILKTVAIIAGIIGTTIGIIVVFL